MKRLKLTRALKGVLSEIRQTPTMSPDLDAALSRLASAGLISVTEAEPGILRYALTEAGEAAVRGAPDGQ